MGPVVDSRIKPPDVGISTFQIEFEGIATGHISSIEGHFTHEPRVVTMKL